VMRVLRARVDAGASGRLVTHGARHAAWADRIVFLRDGSVIDDTGVASGPESLFSSTDDDATHLRIARTDDDPRPNQ